MKQSKGTLWIVLVSTGLRTRAPTASGVKVTVDTLPLRCRKTEASRQGGKKLTPKKHNERSALLSRQEMNQRHETLWPLIISSDCPGSLGMRRPHAARELSAQCQRVRTHATTPGARVRKMVSDGAALGPSNGEV